ncbi:MAG: VWA domain-containing protein [Pseudomonadota bacterium]
MAQPQARAAADDADSPLIDLLPRLALFTEGIAGRAYHVLPADREATPGATLRTLHLPLEPPLAGDARAVLGGYEAVVLQQLAPMLFGTHAFTFDDAATSDSGDILGALQRYFRAQPNPGLARRFFYRLEAIRHDACIRREFPGMARYLNDVNRERWLDALEPATNRLEAVQQTLLLLECDPGANAADAAALDSELRALCESARALREPTAGVADSVALTEALLAWFSLEQVEAIEDPTLMEEIANAEHPTDSMVEMTQQEEAIAGLEFELLTLDDDVEISPGENPGDSAIMRTPNADRDDLKRRIDMQKARMLRGAPATDHSDARSYLYDEWNHLDGKYLRGWCRLFEHTLEPGDPELLNELTRRVGDLARQVRKQFENIRPASLERIRPLEEGDEIYLDALIDHEIDRRTGRVTETRVYSTNTRKKRDIATAFLVDLSASTDDAIPDPNAPAPVYDQDEDPYAFVDEPLEPEDPKRRIIDVQREALWLMAQALSSLGDDFGVYGFSGYGRDEVELFLVKELGQALSGRVLQTIMNMQPRRSTRMGPAIRHAMMKLHRREASRRLIIMISDGFPQDCDYGPDRGDHSYGVQDTAKAFAEAEEAGIETFCITVDTSGHDYLNQMLPKERYMVIEEIEELPLALTKVYRRLAF